jgi:hypothetical protein
MLAAVMLIAFAACVTANVEGEILDAYVVVTPWQAAQRFDHSNCCCDIEYLR